MTLWIFVCAAICFSALNLNAGGNETVYRLVSVLGGEDSPVVYASVVKGADDYETGAVDFGALPFTLWFPKPKRPLNDGASFSDVVTFIADGLPAVNADVKISVQKPVAFSFGEAALCVFSIRGSAKSPGADESLAAANDGIESIVIVGDGMFLADRKNLKVIAGRTRFARKFRYALWRAEVGKREKVEEMDIAWSIVP